MSDFNVEYDSMRDRIFTLLDDSGITQKDFADMMQVSPQTVTDWKKGKSNSFAGKIGLLCTALNTSPSWLLFGSGEKYRSPQSAALLDSQRRISSLQESLALSHDTIYALTHGYQHVLDLVTASRIPVLGDVAAGIPIEAITDVVDYEEIDGALAATGEFFGLRIKGDSMEPRMRDGDVVIVRKQDSAETGDTVVVLVNGDSATVKKIKYGPDGISLIPTNPVHDVQFYSCADVERLPVRVIGKVVELRAKY